MFEVLAFVYENYWTGDTCPERDQLERKLYAVGFDPQQVQDALSWLGDLKLAAQGLRPETGTQAPPLAAPVPAPMWRCTTRSMRMYTAQEQEHLGAPCLGFMHFLESASVLPALMREIVVERALAAPGGPVSLDDFKIIVLMVYWSLGQEPDALILDELCDDSASRRAH